ncbi:MAG: DHH family phosphoesterase [Waddliaceae bacterium]
MKKFMFLFFGGIVLVFLTLVLKENLVSKPNVRITSLISFNQESERVAYPSIADFLESTKLELRNSFEGPKEDMPMIHLVMGNESADVDSIVSSIMRAYFLQQTGGDPQNLYLPLINIPKQDLDLRREILYIFDLLTIDPNTLLFLDDVPLLNKLFDEGDLRLNLVDHNALPPQQSDWASVVESIVDHHVDENIDYPLMEDEDKIIGTTGSAATLVAETIQQSSKPSILTSELAIGLLAPILLDTMNLQNKTKTTDKDVAMVEVLSSKAEGLIPENYYDQLLHHLSNVEGLTPLMLLRKDFKLFREGDLLYGMSSLPYGVIWEPEQEMLFSSSLKDFVEMKKIRLLIIIVPPGGTEYSEEKGLIVFSPSETLLQAVTSHLSDDPELSKYLTQVHQSEDHPVYYYQMSLSMARKFLQPLFKFAENEEIQRVIHSTDADYH